MKIKNHSHTCLMISVVIMVVALVMSLFGYGINLGLDFAGGLNIRYDMGESFTQEDVKNALQAQGITDHTITVSGENASVLQVRIPQLEDERRVQDLQTALENSLLPKYPRMDISTGTSNYVGPIAGAALVRNAVLSVLLATVLMLIYIAIRFDVNSGIAAVIGLIHDVLIMLSFMVLLRNVIQMNSSFIAAMLTIVGYSINNTIVIFDRIRENHSKPAFAHLPREEVVNTSIKESMGRTIGATITTLLTICTLYILGVESIREFSLPIIIGVVSGIYSANMINGYVWAFLEGRRKNRKKAVGKRKPAKA
ncbi:MAG: protein translocase subunit SecF [Clostridia bacterium]|nr:protein translocase subunit SecF [Clostridia bacterium]